MTNTTNELGESQPDESSSYKTWVFVMSGTGEDIANERMNDVAQAEAYSVNPDKNREYEDRLNANEEARKTDIRKLDNLIEKNKQSGQDYGGYQNIKNGKNKEYDKKRSEILAERHLQSPGISKFYLNSDVKKQINENAVNKHGNFRVEVLQGVGTKYLNPAYMDPKTGKMKSYKPLLAQVKGFITGAGEKQNVEYTLALLRAASVKEPNELPERLILNGHSRGAAACIELARAIYLEYGDTIKIAMNISDPVPGPGRRDKSKFVIPPNVDSLVITYAERSSGIMDQAFNPLDINEILFDPSKTTVTTTTLPVSHTLSSEKSNSYIDKDILGLLGEINTGIVKAVGLSNDEKKQYDFKSLAELHADPKKNLPGVRAGRNFIAASDPSLNASLPAALKAFHSQLQEKAYTQETKIESLRDSHRSHVTQATAKITAKIKTDSPQEEIKKDRIKMLDVIYCEGNRANKIKQDKNFLQWKDTIGKELSNMNDKKFQSEKVRIINALNRGLEPLKLKYPDKTNKEIPENIQKKIKAMDYAIEVINKVNRPVNEDKCADYYLTLLQLRDHIKEINSPKSMLAKSFGLLNRFKDNRTGDLINFAINSMIGFKKNEETQRQGNRMK